MLTRCCQIAILWHLHVLPGYQTCIKLIKNNICKCKCMHVLTLQQNTKLLCLVDSNKMSGQSYILVLNINYVSSFSVWNTIMGSSLLTMPWGIQNAGLLMGIITIVMMGGLCLYTTHKILQVQTKHGKSDRLICPSLDVSSRANQNKLILIYAKNVQQVWFPTL